MDFEGVTLTEDADKISDRTIEKSPENAKGVQSCYVFKSRLQEYAQKVGIPTPVYQTLKEGPSHEPVFKSTVIVNDVRYDSLPGFFNRKAAEQSAAEIALLEFHKSGLMTENMPTVHETGLCKNLLQEYAQKMNYAIPSYICTKSSSGAMPFICTVEIGGIQYIGAAARTKKEAEIKAARTALLAIQSQSKAGIVGACQYTVLPGKRKIKELKAETEVMKKIKSKKASFRKKWSKKRLPRSKDGHYAESHKDEPQRQQDEPGTALLEDTPIIASSEVHIQEVANHDS
ncbi:double-stranded RNA-binding protein 8-like isoform X2 [Curcuma longa]